jgi:hypothetical protein
MDKLAKTHTRRLSEPGVKHIGHSMAVQIPTRFQNFQDSVLPWVQHKVYRKEIQPEMAVIIQNKFEELFAACDFSEHTTGQFYSWVQTQSQLSPRVAQELWSKTLESALLSGSSTKKRKREEERQNVKALKTDYLPATGVLASDHWKVIFSFCKKRELGRLECVSVVFKKIIFDSRIWDGLALSLMSPHEKIHCCVLIKDTFCLPQSFDSKHYVKVGGLEFSTKEKALLSAVSKYPQLRAGSEIPIEFPKAFDCMLKGTPQAFKSIEHHGQGTHMAQYSDAVAFLRDCVKKNSIFRQIIDSYKEEPKRPVTSVPHAPETFGELATELEMLLDKVQEKLDKYN